MARTRRQAKEHIEGALTNLEWIQKHMAWIVEQYGERNPEIAGVASAVIESQKPVKDVLEKLIDSF